MGRSVASVDLPDEPIERVHSMCAWFYGLEWVSLSLLRHDTKDEQPRETIFPD